MIENDLKSMRIGSSKKFAMIINIALPLMICIFMMTTLIFLFYTRRAANIEGISLTEFLATGTKKIDVKQNFTGWYVLARESYNQAMMFLAFTVIFLIIWISKIFQIRRDRRILKYLDEKVEEDKS